MKANPKCVDDLVYKKHVCIIYEFNVKEFDDENRNTDGSTFIKAINYQCDPMFVQYEPGSP